MTETSTNPAVDTGPVVLACTGIVKHFPGVLALDGVDFEARRAEIHALVGENGAGKSTLVKILTGVYQPDSGRSSSMGRTSTSRTRRPHPTMGSPSSIKTVLLFRSSMRRRTCSWAERGRAPARCSTSPRCVPPQLRPSSWSEPSSVLMCSSETSPLVNVSSWPSRLPWSNSRRSSSSTNPPPP